MGGSDVSPSGLPDAEGAAETFDTGRSGGDLVDEGPERDEIATRLPGGRAISRARSAPAGEGF